MKMPKKKIDNEILVNQSKIILYNSSELHLEPNGKDANDFNVNNM
jgi:hypothetical protein